MTERLLVISIVARRLGLSCRSVYRLIEAKELPVLRVGPVYGYRVPESGVEEFRRRRAETE